MEDQTPDERSLEERIDSGDVAAIQSLLEGLPPEDVSYELGRIGADDLARLMELLSSSDPELAATLMERLLDTQAATLISVMPPAAAAAIVEAMDSDDRADILSGIDDDRHTQEILALLDPSEAADLRRLVQYPPDTAGGLMITEYLAHPSTRTVAEVLDDLRTNAERYAEFDVQYLYVTQGSGELVGVLRLRDLVLTPGDRDIASIMIEDPARVQVTDRPQQLDAFFDDHAFFAAPVVDAAGGLVGVVRRAAVEAARAEKADRTLLAFGGIIGGEELRAMPFGPRVLRRLAFLCPNIALNLIAASVVAIYEPTIAAVTALAIFLPMLSDMSGCAGNQSVAVSIRELSLGVLKPTDVLRTLGKELGVGVVNGLVLGALLGAIAWVMRGGQWPLIGVVIGGAMAINSVVAVSIGGTVPLVLRRFGIDPALAASPILTTFTDLCGFFLTLRLATAILL
ncbi:MAG: magnesium transporter [Myxococcales bacterium]|nr:magnesium transporter [Myxococcales bacterium]